jgi:ribosomal protein L11 methyltransferase
VDVESVAVRATGENAERNGVADRIDVRHGSVGPGEPFDGRQYDVVLANIIARILIELVDGIVGATRPGGAMVLAGIIQEREADVVAAFEGAGATVVNRRQHEDWVSLVLRRQS